MSEASEAKLGDKLTKEHGSNTMSAVGVFDAERHDPDFIRSPACGDATNDIEGHRLSARERGGHMMEKMMMWMMVSMMMGMIGRLLEIKVSSW